MFFDHFSLLALNVIQSDLKLRAVILIKDSKSVLFRFGFH